MKLFLKILFYFSLVAAGLFFAGLLIMSAFGGNSASWKRQVQDIASGVVGKKVHIGKMNDARLFPNLMFDGEYIYISSDPFTPREKTLSGSQKEEMTTGEENPIPNISEDVIIRKLQASVPFWTIFWGSPSISFLNIEGVVFAAHKDVILESARLDWTTPGTPKLVVEGGYGQAAYNGHFVVKHGWGGAQLQSIIPFEMEVNNVQASGVVNLNPGQLDITDISMILNDQPYKAEFSFPVDAGYQMIFTKDGQDAFVIGSVSEDKTSENMILVSEIEDLAAKEFIHILCAVMSKGSISLQPVSSETQIVTCEPEAEKDQDQDQEQELPPPAVEADVPALNDE